MELAFLKDAQELGLRSGVKIADLIEEERAAVGQFEFSAPHGCRAGEGAFLMAEELAFDQFGRDSGAVDLNERSAGEGAVLVDVRGKKFLAGSGFADDQHAGVGSRGHGSLLDGAQEDRAVADHLGAGSDDFFQPLVLFAEVGLRGRVLEDHQYTFAAERLFEEVECAAAGSFHGVGDGGVAGDHDDRRGHFLLLKPAEEVDAALVGEFHIQDVSVAAGGFGEPRGTRRAFLK